MYIDKVSLKNANAEIKKDPKKKSEKTNFESIRINISNLAKQNETLLSKNIVQNINQKFNYGLMVNKNSGKNFNLFDEHFQELNNMLENEKEAMKQLDKMLMINSIVRRIVKGKRLTAEQRKFLKENPEAALQVQMEVAKEKMLEGPQRRKK